MSKRKSLVQRVVDPTFTELVVGVAIAVPVLIILMIVLHNLL